jgi:4-amino-4-deoxy-L-arabinose transferase-like glycosyltransferase
MVFNSFQNRHLLISLLLCFWLRFIFLGFTTPWDAHVEENIILHADARGYHQLATTLIHDHRFSYTSYDKLNTLRTPGYPLFIAFVYLIFGIKPWVVLVMQVFLDTCSCLILWKAVKRLFNIKIATLTAYLYALDPFLILYCSSLASDILFVFFIVTFFYFFAIGLKEKGKRDEIVGYCLSALFLGIATLVRPISQYLIIFITAFFLIHFRPHLKKAVALSIFFLILFSVVITPWIYRNYKNFGHFSLSSVGSYALLILYVKPLIMEKTGLDPRTAKTKLINEADDLAKAGGKLPEAMNDFQKAEYQKVIAMRYIKESPVRFFKFYCLGMFHTFSNIATSEFSRKLQLPVDMLDIDMKSTLNIIDIIKSFFRSKSRISLFIALIVFLYMLISYIGFLAGFMTAWKQFHISVLFFCSIIFCYFVFITGTTGIARYKLPAIPFYLPFSVIGLQYLYFKIKDLKLSFF